MTDEEMIARFQKALNMGGNVFEMDDVIGRIRAGEMQCFSSQDAFVVTEIGVYPRKKVLHLAYLAGEMEAVLALQPEIEAFGAAHGCAFMSACGRPGWQHVLPKRGWKHTASTFIWPLEGAA